MFRVGLRQICLVLFVQSVIGKSIYLENGYQEIEDQQVISDVNQEESKIIQVDRISEGALQELCGNFRVTIYVKDTNTYIDCFQSLFDDNNMPAVQLVKRDASDKNEEVEGSGDEATVLMTTEKSHVTTIPPPAKEIDSSESPSSPEPVAETSPQSSSETKLAPSTQPSILKEADVNKPESPVLFKNGFDEILKNTPPPNATFKDRNPFILMRAEMKENNGPAIDNGGKSPVATGEEIAQTGESQEKPNTGLPNNVLLIVFAALGIIGTLAFAFNYIKKKKEDKEIDEVLQLEAEGRELKEMKPLMKSPLTQNGAKSLEYIDAEPQNVNGIDTTEMNHHDMDMEVRS